MKKSLVEQVTECLVDAIVEGAYSKNILPSQEVLCAQFEISRSVLREAICGLGSRHMLDIRPRSGTRITPMQNWKVIDGDVVNWRLLARRDDPQFLHDLAAFVAWIGPVAAAQAALHASEGDRRAIRSAYKALLRANDIGTYMAADVALRAAIMVGSGNQLLQQLAGVVHAVRLTAYADNQVSSARAGAELETLANLIESIDARDASGAEAAMADLPGSVTDES